MNKMSMLVRHERTERHENSQTRRDLCQDSAVAREAFVTLTHVRKEKSNGIFDA